MGIWTNRGKGVDKMAKGSTKYQLLKADFDLALKDIRYRDEMIFRLREQVERWEKAYFYFKAGLEKCAYTDHRRCTDVIELDELKDLTSLMDELWREKMESLNKGDVE